MYLKLSLMKRVYLLALFGLCFLFITPNQVFSSTFAKGKEIKVKIINCKVDQTTILANKIEFKVKKRTHKYNLIGGNFAMKSYPFSFDQITYEEFLGMNIDEILKVILTNINNGVMKDNALYSSLEELISNGFMVKVLIKKDTIEKELYFVSCDNIIDKNIANEKLREYTESGYSIIEITTSNMQI